MGCSWVREVYRLARVELQGVTKVFNRTVEAVKELNMVIDDKKVVCLLGPSGCGKTTTMRIIAGLEEPTKGRVLFDGEDVTFLQPSERDVAMVFQFPTVYPHLSLYENLALPLRGIGMDPSAILKRLELVVEQLKIPKDMLQRKAGSIDPGLRQRIAIGRAIVREPKVFLFDEPLTNLDAATRIELMGLIKHLSREVGQTFVYVTHDQSEAMSLADKIAVMKDGQLIQYDSPDVVYEFPGNTFVGWFLGNPGMNFLRVKIEEEQETLYLRVGSKRFRVALETLQHLLRKQSAPECIVGIRPEYVSVSPVQKEDSAIEGLCVFVEFIGGREVFHIRIEEGVEIRTKAFPREDIQEGQKVFVGFPEEKIRIFSLNGVALQD